MENPKKVLQMTFAAKEGKTLIMSIGRTREDLTPEDINSVMDRIVTAGVFKTGKGLIAQKVKARFVTQDIEEVEITQ